MKTCKQYIHPQSKIQRHRRLLGQHFVHLLQLQFARHLHPIRGSQITETRRRQSMLDQSLHRSHPLLFQCQRKNTVHCSTSPCFPIRHSDLQPMEDIADRGAWHIATVLEQIVYLISGHFDPTNVHSKIPSTMQSQCRKDVSNASQHNTLLRFTVHTVQTRSEHCVRLPGGRLAVSNERRIVTFEEHSEHREDRLKVQLVLGAVNGQCMGEGKRPAAQLNESGNGRWRWWMSLTGERIVIVNVDGIFVHNKQMRWRRNWLNDAWLIDRSQHPHGDRNWNIHRFRALFLCLFSTGGRPTAIPFRRITFQGFQNTTLYAYTNRLYSRFICFGDI